MVVLNGSRVCGLAWNGFSHDPHFYSPHSSVIVIRGSAGEQKTQRCFLSDSGGSRVLYSYGRSKEYLNFFII